MLHDLVAYQCDMFVCCNFGCLSQWSLDLVFMEELLTVDTLSGSNFVDVWGRVELMDSMCFP